MDGDVCRRKAGLSGSKVALLSFIFIRIIIVFA